MYEFIIILFFLISIISLYIVRRQKWLYINIKHISNKNTFFIVVLYKLHIHCIRQSNQLHALLM